MDEQTEHGAALVPVRQQVVTFYGDAIPGGVTADGEIYIPLRPLVDYLGLTWPGQRLRVMRDEVLAARVRSVRMAGADGRQRDMLCLPLDLLPGWLFGVTPGKARPELAAKIALYRAEAFRVLWRAFQAEIMPAPAPPADLSPVEQALALAEAVANLARQQLAYEGRLGQVASKQEIMADYLREYIPRNEQRAAAHDERLTALELHLSAGAVISEAQAAELALHVKTVAAALVQHGTANGYQRVYGELYRRYNIGAYRNLPAARFAEALAWLQEWYAELQGGTG